MPLVTSVPPRNLIDSVSKRVGSLVLVPGEHLLSGATKGGLVLAAPHRVHVLPFEAVRRRQDLSHAQPAGWQFLVMAEDRVVATAEVHDEEGKSVAVSGGPFAESLGTAIDHIEVLPEVQRGDYELRILRVNALYLIAAWLVGDERIVIPIAPAPAYVEVGKTYTERGFLEALNRDGVDPFRAPPKT